MYEERNEKTSSEKDKTGIPRKMKASFEQSSGFSFDDVRVHYNSEKPAQLHAHAYTQGNEVYVAPGQEKHLPHELGHVVQQKSDMVKPTSEIDGLPLNDDESMENGADKIAEEAEDDEASEDTPVQAKAMTGGVVQRNAVNSSEAYNAWAGFGSTFVGMLGMVGGIGSFLYTKHAERKHRYIEDVEKYADAACEAREDQIDAKERFDSLDDSERSEKAKARAEVVKLGAKITRNYKTALKKAFLMDNNGMFKNVTRAKYLQESNKKMTGMFAQSTDPEAAEEDDVIKYIKDEHAKDAVNRARKANESKIDPSTLTIPVQPQ